MPQNTIDFSAKEPSLGYLYQIRYSLLLLLKENDNDATCVRIECIDDIDIIRDNGSSFFQTKYHKKSEQTFISDRSTEFWKTIRVWSEQIFNGEIDLSNSIFNLVSTASVKQDSVIYKLKTKKTSNDLKEIVTQMNAISKEKTNESNKKGYLAFNNLSLSQKERFIENISIIDKSLDFHGIEDRIKKNYLKLFLADNQLNIVYEQLEGWWFNKCLNHLIDVHKNPYITFSDLRNQIIFINDQVKLNNLTDDFPKSLDISDNEINSKENFLNQLRLINATKSLLRNAISDYRRSFNQRSKWVRTKLIDPQELIAYDNELVDYWEPKFGLMNDLSDGKSENELNNLGFNFYKKFYIENVPQIFLREKFSKEYLFRGCSHLLADSLKIGWHPKYKELIK